MRTTLWNITEEKDKNMRNTPLKAFASPLKHDMEKEHAHSEDASRSSRPYITVDGEHGSTMNIENVSGHSSTQGTYGELYQKSRDKKIKEIRTSQKKKKK
jgi:hypothetical protein